MPESYDPIELASRDEIAAVQLERLRSTLRHAYENVEHYRSAFDDVGVRQLGGLASELAKQTAEKAKEQQDVVLKDAQQLDLDSLYRQEPIGTWPPGENAADDGACANYSRRRGLNLSGSRRTHGA